MRATPRPGGEARLAAVNETTGRPRGSSPPRVEKAARTALTDVMADMAAARGERERVLPPRGGHGTVAGVFAFAEDGRGG